jgi:hypothetical protein
MVGKAHNPIKYGLYVLAILAINNPITNYPKPNYPQFNNNVNMPNFNTRNCTTRRKK